MVYSFVIPTLALGFVCLDLAFARPPVPSHPEASAGLRSRQDAPSINARDPYDHKWVTNLAAVGDSYAAGLGSGHAIKATRGVVLNTDCYQYSYGYPNLLNSDAMIGDNSGRTFHYLPCSGAKVPDLDAQIEKMSASDVVTLSIGGNDIGFVDIINYCIYQWYTWEPFWTCQGELNSAKKTVNSDDFAKSLTAVLKKVDGKLKNQNSRIYWTGYERFWNADTPECDQVTWAFTRKLAWRQFLTKDHRKQMNELTDSLNSKIQEACKTNDRCVYVDTNAQVEQQDGQFCAPGVDEKYRWPGGGTSANREATTTYQWGTTKDDDTDEEAPVDQPTRRETPPSIKIDNSTWEGNVAWLIREGLKNDAMDPNITEHALPGFTAEAEVVPATLPDYYAKIFHRTKWGNGMVAVNVLKAMEIEQGKMMNQPVTATKVPFCEPTANSIVLPSTTPTPTETSGVPACKGNQIQGTCTQGHLPIATANSGPATPVCNKVGTGSFVRISKSKAKDAASQYCYNLVNDRIVLDAGNPSAKPAIVSDGAENGGQLAIAVLFDVNRCDPNTSPEDQKLDFGAMSLDDCFNSMFVIFADICAQDSTWQDYNEEFPLIGGVYGYKCAMWSMSGNS